MPYQTEAGEHLRLTKQIGHGGEGDVFLVDGKEGVVAKIYHAPVSDSHEHKLQNMLALNSPKLRGISAWPIQFVRKRAVRGVHGILLPFANGMELHAVYGPAERKQALPEATWEFLLFVARNLAIVFDTVHSHNVVIGDVNEKNFLVDKRAIVRVIDCDSFQIPSRTGSPFLCTVGVEHYTPPELQGTDLSRCTRTKNHDYFGLAVLIFQLLLMARHPFALVSSDTKIASLSFGESIRRFLYAYGRRAPALGISPPPLTLPTSILPQPLLELFEMAFCQSSAQSRPTASCWMAELDRASKSIVTCRFDKSHRYCNHLNVCPWCEFTKNTSVSFFVSFAVHSAFDLSTGDIASFRAAMVRVQKLSLAKRNASSFGIVVGPAERLPFHLRLPAPQFYLGLILIATSIALAMTFPICYFGVIGGICLLANGRHTSKYKEERDVRRATLSKCNQAVETLYAKYDDIAKSYESAFTREREQVLAGIEKYSKIDAERTRSLRELESSRPQLQLDRYLERFLITRSKISDIGSTRRATLVSYGIESAADVKYADIHRIPGFGDHLCGVLVAWRKACERDFKFDPTQPVPRSDVDALNKKISDKKLLIQDSIRKGLHSLSELNARTQAQCSDVDNRLSVALKELKEADVHLAAWK
jgi:DNA-binding helix-hairpin-helix protein with protein kinase domain